MSIQVKTEFKKGTELTRRFEKGVSDVLASKQSALGSVGYAMRQSYLDYIRSEGQGSWPKPHPLTSGYRKAGTKLIPRQNQKTGLENLAKFLKYFLKTNRVETGFSFNNFGPNQNLEKIADRLNQGFDIQVTDKMRKFLAVYGYPIRKTTTVLNVPPRSLTPVQKDARRYIFKTFIRKFEESMERKFVKGEK